MLKGILIKECLRNENIIDMLNVEKVELWKTDDKPKYWTAIYFVTSDNSFPKTLSKNMDKNWYCDMKYLDSIKIIVLKGKVLQYTIGNEAEKIAVIKKCKRLGLPQDVLNWSE